MKTQGYHRYLLHCPIHRPSREITRKNGSYTNMNHAETRTSGRTAMPSSILRISIGKKTNSFLSRMSQQMFFFCLFFLLFSDKSWSLFYFFGFWHRSYLSDKKWKKSRTKSGRRQGTLSICWLLNDQCRIENSHPNTYY